MNQLCETTISGMRGLKRCLVCENRMADKLVPRNRGN